MTKPQRKVRKWLNCLTYLSALLGWSVSACAQAVTVANLSGDAAHQSGASLNQPKTGTPPSAFSVRLQRWFDFSKVMLATRYMYVENTAGAKTVNTVQHRQDLFGRFKFDAAGRYSLNFSVQSGRRFTAGWNETGVGVKRGNLNLYLKHLYLSAQPVKGLELQYGSFDFLRGAATEITTYNNDGFLSGQRVIVRRPRELFFDEIAYTAGYFGDLTTPNLNRRYHRLKQVNYHQFILSKKLGERAQASADYTFVGGADILRQAVKINTPELRVFDSLRLELYERLDGAVLGQADMGFALLGEKILKKNWTLTGGYTQIDPRYGNVNADRVFQGKHLYGLVTYQLTPDITLSVFTSRILDEPRQPLLPVRVRSEVFVRYNLLKALQRTGWLK
ncbi:MAG: hypothetical protein JNJ50_15740 [Acidobacteria bacterium]|nr:hypothetical protein [Acidobacteriota bacterium]